MRKSNEQSLKSVLEDLMNAYKLKSKINEINIVNSWEKIMGKTIARNTSKIFIKEGKLYLTIDSAPLRQELQYAKSKIVELVNREMGEELIDDVVLR